MQNFFKLLFVMAALASISLMSQTSLVKAAGTEGDKIMQRRESALVEFTSTVRLQGVLLRGEYIVVHDEALMAKGQPCTYIYRNNKGQEGELVASFHCIHVEREKVAEFKIKFSPRQSAYDTPEVLEIQFAGSRDGHRVPSE